MKAVARAALGLALLPLIACAPKPHVQVAAPAGPWSSLFDGKDLDGWTVKIAGHPAGENYRNTFRVENGMLAVSYADYDRFDNRFGSLFTKQKFSHYWLRAEYRFVGDQVAGAPGWAFRNSGLQLHSQAPETMRQDQDFPVSVEFDLVGGRFWGHHPTGDVCQNGTRVRIQGAPVPGQCSKVSDITVPGDAWVTVLAEVRGSERVRQIVNGALVVEYTDVTLDPADPDARALAGAVPSAGPVPLGSGAISIQANSHPIEFRRIEVLPID